jgi:hypothetical protein
MEHQTIVTKRNLQQETPGHFLAIEGRSLTSQVVLLVATILWAEELTGLDNGRLLEEVQLRRTLMGQTC